MFRQTAYFIAAEFDASMYVLNCVCNNYGLVRQRYDRRLEARRRKEHLFDEWVEIQTFHNSYQTFDKLDKEAMPDGRPVPIIRYDSEKDTAEMVYSDGSETIETILEAINGIAAEIYLKAAGQ